MGEDIFIDESEVFDDVWTRKQEMYTFPTVVFAKYSSGLVAYFNSRATLLFGNANRIAVKISNDYVVFIPSSDKRHNRLVLQGKRYNSSRLNVAGLYGRIPVGARFRCYPYNGGIAIRRNEPIVEAKR